MKSTQDYFTALAPKSAHAAGEVFELKKDLLNRYLRPEDVVLEAGCGNGDFLKIIQSKVKQGIGMDENKAMLDDAKKRCGGDDFILGDITDLSQIPLRGIDAIVSYSTLYYLQDRKKFFLSARHILKPGGLIICDVLNAYSVLRPYVQLRFRVTQYFNDVPKLKRWLERNGFEVLEEFKADMSKLKGHWFRSILVLKVTRKGGEYDRKRGDKQNRLNKVL